MIIRVIPIQYVDKLGEVEEAYIGYLVCSIQGRCFVQPVILVDEYPCDPARYAEAALSAAVISLSKKVGDDPSVSGFSTSIRAIAARGLLPQLLENSSCPQLSEG